MARYKLTLPKMGESVSEATLIKWVKQIGDPVEIDDTIVEIATDKVDSEVPSPVNGILVEQLFKEDEVAQVGDVIAIIEIEGNGSETDDSETEEPAARPESIPGLQQLPDASTQAKAPEREKRNTGGFLSPLVRSIAQEEHVSPEELETISGSGLEGRITKQDILDYVGKRSRKSQTEVLSNTSETTSKVPEESVSPAPSSSKPSNSAPTFTSGQDEIVEMDRMRKLIADHMVNSVRTAPHVCSFVEADVTNLVTWRNKVKSDFEKREGTRITFTPIFIEAVTKAIRDFPMINVSVNGTQIIKKKNINIGMAAALPSGNLIVPVIKNADQLNLVGLSKAVNDLAQRARANKLKPDETQGGTFTLTNIGSFGNVMGTPIINQPQVAILAVGTITKKPAVIETEYGDVIAIRHMMFLSLSYDHRVVDGVLGGQFVRRVADYLEQWDVNEEY